MIAAMRLWGEGHFQPTIVERLEDGTTIVSQEVTSNINSSNQEANSDEEIDIDPLTGGLI